MSSYPDALPCPLCAYGNRDATARQVHSARRRLRGARYACEGCGARFTLDLEFTFTEAAGPVRYG